jgi:hypothetical protein
MSNTSSSNADIPIVFFNSGEGNVGIPHHYINTPRGRMIVDLERGFSLSAAGEVVMRSEDELRETLAELCHSQWSGWMEYLFSKGHIERIIADKSLDAESSTETVWVMPEWALHRWQRQMKTPYAELSEGEKESDRKEADRFLEVLAKWRSLIP